MITKLYLDNNKIDQSGRKQIRISVTQYGKRVVTSLGCTMNEIELQALVRELKGDKYRRANCHPRHDELVAICRNIETAIYKERQKVAMKEKDASQIDIRAIINDAKGRKSSRKDNSPLVSVVAISFMRDEKIYYELTEATHLHIAKIIRRVAQFNPNLTIAQLSKQETLRDFEQFLIKRKLSNSTTKNYIVVLKWFLQWCHRKGLCSDSFMKYSSDLRTVDNRERVVIFLTMEEIHALENLELKSTKKLCRDIFLFSCYTGLRHSDIARLKKSDINNGTLNIEVKKTGICLSNKLNKFAIAICDEYTAIYKGELLFPPITITEIDRQIKNLARDAGINELVRKVSYHGYERNVIEVPKWQLLAMHAGRRSFVVNSLDMGLTPTQVIAYTGHSTIQAMQPYISISNKKKDAAMDVWNQSDSTDKKENEAINIDDLVAMLKKKLKEN